VEEPARSVTQRTPEPVRFPQLPGTFSGVFFLFSNRLGCLGSLLLSAVLTLVLLLVFNVL
jgi:hypothetical protein